MQCWYHTISLTPVSLYQWAGQPERVPYQRCLAESPPQTPSAGSSFTSQRQCRCNPKVPQETWQVSYATSSFYIPITNVDLTPQGERGNSHCAWPSQMSPRRARTLPRRWFPLLMDSTSQTINPICAWLPWPAISNRHQFHLPEFLVPLLNQLSRRFQNTAQVAEIESNCPCVPLSLVMFPCYSYNQIQNVFCLLKNIWQAICIFAFQV